MDYYYGSSLNRETLSEQFDMLLDDENMTKFQQDYFATGLEIRRKSDRTRTLPAEPEEGFITLLR